MLDEYVKAQTRKLARDRSDRHQSLTRITWDNAHTFFGKESEFPAPGVCEICPAVQKTGRQPDLGNSAVAERHLTGGDHLAALAKRAQQIRSKGVSAQAPQRGHYKANRVQKFAPCPLYDCQGMAAYYAGDKAALCNFCSAKVVVPL